MSNQAALKLVGKEDGDKQRALEAALAQIDRAFGKGSVMKLGEKGKVEMESSPPARSAWTSRWASAACPRGG
jgi:recombination protein RecA